MVTYTKSVTADFGGNINMYQFTDIVKNSSIATNFQGGQTYGDVVELFFSVALTGPEIIILNGLISTYVYIPLLTYYPYDAVQYIDTIGNGVGLVNYQYGPNVVLYNMRSGPTNLTSVNLNSNSIVIDGSASLVNTSFLTLSNVQNIFPNSQVLTTGNGLTINSNGMLTSGGGFFGSIYTIFEGTPKQNSTMTPMRALTLYANSLLSGFYRVGWAMRFNSTSNNKSTVITVTANTVDTMTTEQLDFMRQVPTDVSDFISYSSFKQISLSGNAQIELDFYLGDPGAYSANVINPRIELWRVM